MLNVADIVKMRAWLGLLLLLLTGAKPVSSAAQVSVFPLAMVPNWLQQSAMTLEIFGHSGGATPLSYSVGPLASNGGMNQSEDDSIMLSGNMVSVSSVNYVNVTGNDTVVYLSCDTFNSSRSNNSDVLDSLMNDKPAAILFYSVRENCCILDGFDLPYHAFYTMTDASEASQTLDLLSSANDALRVTIMNNSTAQPVPEQTPPAKSSSVAMSILYAITGIITLLFLAIIITGAVRAHRNPARYGPRSAYGGRPRQSRARGIARAVLETLPVVKFGDPEPAKPDLARDLETHAATPSGEQDMGTSLSSVSGRQQSALQGGQSEYPSPQQVGLSSEAQPAATTDQQGTGTDDEHQPEQEEHLGCSICAEDFIVGEDVRVLPCDHKFHPACIDPWLVNVSGTCPLCRLDLRPRKRVVEEGDTGSQDFAEADDSGHLPPPLEANMDGSETMPAQRRRSSLLNPHSLRAATVEESIEMLRRHRSQQQGPTTSVEQAAGRNGARDRNSTVGLSGRLRDKFRIRTRIHRSQEAGPSEDGPSH